MTAFDKAWDVLKALPEQQMGLYAGLGTVHPAAQAYADRAVADEGYKSAFMGPLPSQQEVTRYGLPVLTQSTPNPNAYERRYEQSMPAPPDSPQGQIDAQLGEMRNYVDPKEKPARVRANLDADYPRMLSPEDKKWIEGKQQRRFQRRAQRPPQ